MQRPRAIPRGLSALTCTLLLAARGQSVDDPNLRIETYLSGLSQPTGMRFFGPNEGFLIEKASGQVKLFNAGAMSTVLDLKVQSGSEHGLLGVALDPGSSYLRPDSSSLLCSGEHAAKSDWIIRPRLFTAAGGGEADLAMRTRSLT